MTSDYQTFEVMRAPGSDLGTNRVRIHWTRRPRKHRYEIVRIENKAGTVVFASALGHNNQADKIGMDFDLRHALGTDEGEKVELSISHAGLVGRWRWYLGPADPATRIPAWLAFWSVILGSAGIIIGVISIIKS